MNRTGRLLASLRSRLTSASAAAASLVPTDHAPADAAAAAQAGIARRRSGECRACGELRRQILTQTDRQTA
jgi:hypothetical protein